jgi:hypothetical protein
VVGAGVFIAPKHIVHERFGEGGAASRVCVLGGSRLRHVLRRGLLLRARISAFASGGILAMLSNPLIPFANERSKSAGLWTVVGFSASFAMGLTVPVC